MDPIAKRRQKHLIEFAMEKSIGWVGLGKGSTTTTNEIPELGLGHTQSPIELRNAIISTCPAAAVVG